MKEIEILNNCSELLKRAGTTSSIHELVSLYQEIALKSVFLGEVVADYKLKYNTSYYNRKIETSHSYITNKMEKMTDKSAMQNAEIKNKDLLLQELNNEALVIRVETFLRQVNRALDALRTRISFEKTEMDRVKKDDII